MAIFEDIFPGVIIGAVVGLAGPTVLKVTRPVLKTVVKTGIVLGEQVRERTEGAREVWDDLVAEARTDLDQRREETASEAENEPVEKPKRNRKKNVNTEDLSEHDPSM